ncbi:hypothetical protein HKX48_005393 [Thoreauomyces humboldtii]|nr:hypothetical protein HKX48_005393 [Thoreauomyces humboldtii]
MSVLVPASPLPVQNRQSGAATTSTVPTPTETCTKNTGRSQDAVVDRSMSAASPQKKKLRVEAVVESTPLLSPTSAARPDAGLVAPAAEIETGGAEPSPACLVGLPPPAHHITWTVSAEKGYKNMFGGNRLSIHEEMEDVHWPASEADGRLVGEHVSRNGTRLFVLADGHGGVEAPRFFVAGATRAVMALLESRDWDFGVVEQQQAFREQVHTAFQILDASYSSKKVEEYRKWIDGGKDKPVDDGCTLVVNVLARGWIVNINVGDSRTVLATRTDSTWEPVFQSSDHNMTHPAKIHHIQKSGGQFIYPYGTLEFVQVPVTENPPTRPYLQLAGMRIYRPPTPQIRAVGVSHRRTLNLSATMGDLLFKVEPAVLSCLPDVEFAKVKDDSEYILIAATDGVWDHMRVQETSLQNQIIVQRIASFIDAVPSPAPTQQESSADAMDSPTTLGSPSPATSGVPEIPVTTSPQCDGASSTSAAQSERVEHCRRLALASRTLVERERGRNRAWNDTAMESLARLSTLGQNFLSTVSSASPSSPSSPTRTQPDLFYTGQARYDDATAIIVHLRPTS